MKFALHDCLRPFRNPWFLFLFLVLLGLFALLVLLPNFFAGTIPGRDSGVFLYVGEQILDGKIPYRDVWDHKGPLLYYLNALGLFIGNGTIGGVWFLEYISLVIAAYLGFRLLQEAFGGAAAGTAVWLLNAFLLQSGGNLTETYTLPLQFAALYLFWRSLKSERNGSLFFVIGMTLGAALLLRPNNIGAHLAIGIYLLASSAAVRAWGSLGRKFFSMFMGAFLVLGGTAVYFARHRALSSLVDQLFIYNLRYVAASSENRLISTLAILVAFISFGLLVVALAAWIIGCYQSLRQTLNQETWGPLVHLALIGLPVEVFLAGFSGLIFAHYAIALLPVLAILTAFFLNGVLVNLAQQKRVLRAGFLLLLLGFTIYKPVIQIAAALTAGPASSARPVLLTDIETAAAGHDYLLMWGAEAVYNFLTDKPSPSRYVYQYPLYTADYADSEMVDELLAGIVRERPLIIDASAANPNVPPLDSDKRADWLAGNNQRRMRHITQDVTLLQDVFDYIQKNYTITDVAGEDNWPIYTYVDGGK